MIQRIEYKVGDDILEIIKNTLYRVYSESGIVGADPSREATIYSGVGGIQQIDKAVKEMAITSGLVINASDVGMSDKTPHITTYIVPFLVTMKIILDPEMNPEGNVEYRYIDGYSDISLGYRIVCGETTVAEIVCVGKRPEFRQELINLIRESGISRHYNDMGPTNIAKYIMNCLKNLQ